MATMLAGGNWNSKIRLGRRVVSTVSAFFVFAAVIYEFPASVVMGVWSSYGIADASGFIDLRIKFAAVVIAICTVNLISNLRHLRQSREFWIYLFIFSYMLAVVWVNRDEYAFLKLDAIQSASAFEFWLPKFFKYVLFFLIGLQLSYLRAYRYLLLLSLIIAGAIVIQHVDTERLGLNPRDFIPGAEKGVYLFLGDAFSITALLTIALFERKAFRTLIFIFSAAVVFLIGSRTSFLVFTFVFLSYTMLLFRLKWLPYYLAICLAIIAVGSTIDFEELADRNKRMVGLFLDFEDDNSVQGRLRFHQRGWEDINNSPIWGRFGGQRDSGQMFAKEGWHSYMHNVVSYWRQFGLILFLSICYIYYRFGQGIVSKIDQRHNSDFRVYFLLGTFIIIESLFSRSFAFTATHIIFGIAISMYLPKHAFAFKSSRSEEVDLNIDGRVGRSGRVRRRRRSKKRYSV